MRLLLIGQAPSRRTDGGPAFSGRCGEFLAELIGVSRDELLAEIEAANLIGRWPGKAGAGDAFPAREAAAAAGEIDLAGRRVILAGRGVSRAFGFGGP